MKKRVWLILLFLCLLLASFASAVDISSCQTISGSGSYVLTQNISANETCITITANNVLLDGAGYTIGYGLFGRGYAIANGDEYFSQTSYNNLTIINVTINQSSDDYSSSHAIYTEGNNTIIANSSITTHGISCHPIYFGTDSDNGRVESNNIITTGASSYGIHSYTNSNHHLILNNDLNVSFYGIHLYGNNNTVTNNTLLGNIGFGMRFTGNNNQVFNNAVTLIGASSSNGLAFASSNNNIIYANTLNVTQGNAIYSSSSGNLTFSNNTLIDNGRIQLYILSDSAGRHTLRDQNVRNYSILNSGVNLSVENTTYGKIDFTSEVNGTSEVLYGHDGADIVIGNNSVFVNSSSNVGLNKSANVTLYGIGDQGFSHPAILKNGDFCTDCTNFTSLTANSVIFNVSGWSNYSIGEDPRYIDSCRLLNVTGRHYTLTQNVNTSGTCFQIAADGITLDGAGFTLDYSQSYSGLAINNSVPYNNLTIKNLVIISTNSSAISQGIYSSGSNISIINNSINISSGSAILLGTVNSGLITNNTILNNGGGYGIYAVGGQSVDIEDNNITANAIGLDIESNNYRILNNNVFSSDSYALFFRSNSSVISNNHFTSIDPGEFPLIHLSNPSFNNIFSGNTLNSTTGVVIYSRVLANANNTFTENTIIDNGLNELFIAFDNVDGNHFQDQKIRRYNLSSVGSKLIIENTTYGKIEFILGINGSGSNLVGNASSEIIFGNNSVFINSSSNSGLNKSANVTLYQVGDRGFSYPVILKDGEECSDCVAFTSLTADTVIFNVSSWSNYSIGEDPTPPSASSGSLNSGSSSSSGSSGIPPRFRPTNTTLQNGYERTMLVNWSLDFTVIGKTHTLLVEEITADEVRIKMMPEGQSFILHVGEEKKIELSGDEYYDFAIFLATIDYRNEEFPQARLVFRTIHEERVQEVMAIEESQTTEPIPVGASEDQEISHKYLLIVFGVSILMGLVLFLRLKWKRK